MNETQINEALKNYQQVWIRRPESERYIECYLCICQGRVFYMDIFTDEEVAMVTNTGHVVYHQLK